MAPSSPKMIKIWTVEFISSTLCDRTKYDTKLRELTSNVRYDEKMYNDIKSAS